MKAAKGFGGWAAYGVQEGTMPVTGRGGGGRPWSLYATPPSPPLPPQVLRDSGVGAMAPMAPNFFCACFPFIKLSMF